MEALGSVLPGKLCRQRGWSEKTTELTGAYSQTFQGARQLLYLWTTPIGIWTTRAVSGVVFR